MTEIIDMVTAEVKPDFVMQFDIGTIKHLGLQMYSTLPPVIGELVANAWDANAHRVEIAVPIGFVTNSSEIVVSDDGSGMSDAIVREAYLIMGRDRREEEQTDVTPELSRKVMGRKGIGKLSGFGIAGEIEVESVKDGETTRFRMNYDEFKRNAVRRQIVMPPLPPTGSVTKGTRITLRYISKFRTRIISIPGLRRALARRFSVIGDDFVVIVNGNPITAEERDLKSLLESDVGGRQYLWEYDNEEIQPDTGWRVSGWIGAIDRNTKPPDGVQHGIVIMARGKLVQEPFMFDAVVGQQYALSYLIGEINAEFVDAEEDTIGTSRNALVWDTDANTALKEWGQAQVNKIAREWAEKRSNDNEASLAVNPLYLRFEQEARQIGNSRAKKVADKLIRDMVRRNPVADEATQMPVIQLCLDFLEFDAFWDLAKDLTDVRPEETGKLIDLFREWEVVEAKEMMRVTEGRIATIQKLQLLIETNALEVPTLHGFLKEFPWVLDPRWNLVADERRYSQLLRDRYPDDSELEEDRRIDFLCVREGTQVVVVEIKRPLVKASVKELAQIEEYVAFMRDYILHTTDPTLRLSDVTGYLLCGTTVDTFFVRDRLKTLERSGIYVRRYTDLLEMVRSSHAEFLTRYEQLRVAKGRSDAPLPPAS
jgi:hypothetical protein